MHSKACLLLPACRSLISTELETKPYVLVLSEEGEPREQE